MKIFRLVLAGVVLTGILSQIFDRDPGPSFFILFAAAEGLLLVLLAGKLWKFRQTCRQNKGLSWPLVQRALEDLVPSTVAMLVVHELRLSLATGRVLLMRKIRTSWSEPTFHPLDGSHYGFIWKLVMLLVISELPLVHLLLNALLQEGIWKSVLLIGHALSSLYVLMWLVGDYRLLLESPGIQLLPAGVKIEIGIRAFGMMPYSSIASVDVSSPPEVPPGHAPIKEPETLRLTLHEKPNVLLTLHHPMAFVLILGIRKSARKVRLYVSDPQLFMGALNGFRASTG
ncbi:MAG: hypothetical protein M3Q07_00735 [Pseudobdellovibrionaceae bacterium]|nr:hypothetical protein [Pseudobdellovibrionaceae bacterium]